MHSITVRYGTLEHTLFGEDLDELHKQEQRLLAGYRQMSTQVKNFWNLPEWRRREIRAQFISREDANSQQPPANRRD